LQTQKKVTVHHLYFTSDVVQVIFVLVGCCLSAMKVSPFSQQSKQAVGRTKLIAESLASMMQTANYKKKISLQARVRQRQRRPFRAHDEKEGALRVIGKLNSGQEAQITGSGCLKLKSAKQLNEPKTW